MKPTIALVLALAALGGCSDEEESIHSCSTTDSYSAVLPKTELVGDRLIIIETISDGKECVFYVGAPLKCEDGPEQLRRTTYVARDGKIVVEKIEDGTRTYEPQPDKMIETWKVRK